MKKVKKYAATTCDLEHKIVAFIEATSKKQARSIVNMATGGLPLNPKIGVREVFSDLPVEEMLANDFYLGHYDNE